MDNSPNAPTLSPLPLPAVASGAASGDLTPVQVSVVSVPPALDALSHSVQITAVPQAVSPAPSGGGNSASGGEVLSLASVLGKIEVALPKNLARDAQQNLTQSLMTLIDTQRPLTVSLQAGNSGGTPSLGVLLVPAAPQTAAQTSAINTPALSTPTLQTLPSVRPGAVLSGLVLPPIPSFVAPTSNLLSNAPPVVSAPTPLTPPLNIPAQPTAILPATTTTQAQPSTPAPSQGPNTLPTASAVSGEAAPLTSPPSDGGPSIIAAQAAKLYVQTRGPLANLPQTPLTPALPNDTSAPQTSSTPPTFVPSALNSYRPAQPILLSPASPIIPPEPNPTSPSPPPPLTPSDGTLSNTTPPPSAARLPPFPDLRPISTTAATPIAAESVSAAPTPPAATSSLPPAALIPGRAVEIKVIEIVPPTTNATPAPNATAPSATPSPAQLNATPPSPAPQQPQAMPAQQSAATQITATVVGRTTDGKMILQTDAATLYVETPVSAPVGATLRLEVTPKDDTPALTRLPAPSFSSLPALFQSIAQADPTLAPRLLTFMPQADDALTGALLVLFSAYKSGDAKEWLGRAASDALTALGKGGALDALSKDLQTQATVSRDASVGEWRSYPLPLYNAGAFQALTLHVHRDRDPRRSDAQTSGASADRVRFLIDMTLTKLGAMQLDGFVQAKKIDMIVRSERILPEGLHENLRLGYGKALGAVGFGGTLSFQVGRQGWIAMNAGAQRGLVT